MELLFLGTGAGMPTSRRNVTSIALRFLDRGAFWLFDCGEGTQHQLMKTPLKLGKLEKLWITHLHGDHLFGLPGLLTSRAHQGATAPLTVFGPPGLQSFIDTALSVSQSRLGYELTVIEAEGDYWPGTDGALYEDERYRIFAARLDHRITSYGYRIEEKDFPGRLNDAKLAALGVPPGPVYGQLKRGHTVTLDNGLVLRPEDFVAPPVPGRIVAIMGDTRFCEQAVRLAAGADVLVHEATFGRDLDELARRYRHATTRDAAEVARQAGVGTLIVTHLSSRYQEDGGQSLLQETREDFANAYVAEDFWGYGIPRKTGKSAASGGEVSPA